LIGHGADHAWGGDRAGSVRRSAAPSTASTPDGPFKRRCAAVSLRCCGCCGGLFSRRRNSGAQGGRGAFGLGACAASNVSTRVRGAWVRPAGGRKRNRVAREPIRAGGGQDPLARKGAWFARKADRLARKRNWLACKGISADVRHPVAHSQAESVCAQADLARARADLPCAQPDFVRARAKTVRRWFATAWLARKTRSGSLPDDCQGHPLRGGKGRPGERRGWTGNEPHPISWG
jgi:hypothetical protein